jgi:hypothetical protein
VAVRGRGAVQWLPRVGLPFWEMGHPFVEQYAGSNGAITTSRYVVGTWRKISLWAYEGLYVGSHRGPLRPHPIMCFLCPLTHRRTITRPATVSPKPFVDRSFRLVNS